VASMKIVQLIMDNFSFIFNCLVIAETVLAALLSFILFVFKKNKNANFFLAIFIIVHAVSFLPVFLTGNQLYTIAYWLTFFTFPANSLTGVFIYYYTLFMTGRAEKINKRDIIHFLFGIVFIIVNAFSYDFKEYSQDSIFVFIMIQFGVINSLIYTILSFIKIKKYSRDIKNYTSNIERIDISWLNKIIYFSVLSSIVFIVCYWLFLSVMLLVYAVSIDILIFIAILFILAYYIINQPEIGKGNREMYSILNDLKKRHDNTAVKRYDTIHFDKQTQESYLRLLDEYMENHKPYLNERITIKDISEGLNLPYYHLSIMINNLLKKNFCDLINEYRIREAINILNDSKKEAVNILTIAFKCGFNSKSTFNRVFKNKTGTTPSKYKKSVTIQM
jgi:AraC-like DNA-binding protein